MNGRRLVTDRYINPLTDFGFKRTFGTEPTNASSSPVEQGAYEDSLKYYRDLNNVVDTSWQESREEGREEGRDEGATRVLIRLLEKWFGRLSDSILKAIRSLAVEESEALGEAQIDFESLSALEAWIKSRSLKP